MDERSWNSKTLYLNLEASFNTGRSTRLAAEADFRF
jgi:hypothetical protein